MINSLIDRLRKVVRTIDDRSRKMDNNFFAMKYYGTLSKAELVFDYLKKASISADDLKPTAKDEFELLVSHIEHELEEVNSENEDFINNFNLTKKD